MLSCWSTDDVQAWLNENHLETLVPLFKVHKIDGKELDRIREKNDSKVNHSAFKCVKKHEWKY